MMLNSSKPILQANGLTFRFSQQQIFNDFSASLAAGITYVIGGESTGKSTLLRLFAGDLTAQAGQITINSIQQTNDVENFRKNVFWIDPRTTTHDQLSPNTYFDLQRSFYPSFDDALLVDLIQELSLTEHVSKAIYMLSAGSKRKVWLAAAFASGAVVTLLDEPFAALDKASIGFLLTQLEKSSQNSQRAWVIADYQVPENLSISQKIDLG
jgi:ABC-type multidrug transport system ATPase subunit